MEHHVQKMYKMQEFGAASFYGGKNGGSGFGQNRWLRLRKPDRILFNLNCDLCPNHSFLIPTTVFNRLKPWYVFVVLCFFLRGLKSIPPNNWRRLPMNQTCFSYFHLTLFESEVRSRPFLLEPKPLPEPKPANYPESPKI